MPYQFQTPTFDVQHDSNNLASSVQSASTFGNPMGNQAQIEQMRHAQGAEAAKNSVIERTGAHHNMLAERGVGLYYGDLSSFHQLPEEDKQDWLNVFGQETGGISQDDLTQSSCIQWAMEHVEAWYEGVGQPEVYLEIAAQAKAANLKGTELAKLLVSHGWQAWYFNPDTSYQGPEEAPDSEHSYSNHVAETQGTYYDVPIAGRVVDTDANPERLNPLEATPFFLTVARGGLHVTAGVDGQISELAQSEGPDQQVIYQDPFRDIVDIYAQFSGGDEAGQHSARRMWGSGLIVVPPGTAPLGPEFVSASP